MRSLADDIRRRSDDDLGRLLLRRPDLARPAPADLTALAARASTRASAQRAVDHLDLAHLQALEAATVAGSPVDVAEVARLLGDAPAETVSALLDDLWASALLWQAPEGRHVVRTVAEVLGPSVAGLGPGRVDLGGTTGWTTDGTADDVEDLLARAQPPARAVLDRLARGPAVATLPHDPDSPTGTAVGWLLAVGALVRLDDDRVGMPRELALALRRGRLHERTHLAEPDVSGTGPPVDDVDATAGAQVSDLLLVVDELASTWGPEPPRVLRAGGLSVRDLAALAAALDVDTGRAAFVAETAWGAGLVDDDGGLEPVWAPTDAYDTWRQYPGARQWIVLARAWLTSTRAPHLVGRTAQGGRVNALGPDAQWPPIRSLREDLLDVLATAPEGVAPDDGVVRDVLTFRRPRRLPRDLEDVVRALRTEAEWLGVTGRGALSTAGRRLVADAPEEELTAALHPHLPPPVERVLLQADLTAIAPGPLVGSLAQFMRLVADVESRGGATVYRFSETTVRRCLDTGWTAEQVLGALEDASDTPVPQPLDYLVRDVARRHGHTRVGRAETYIRSDDEAGLDALAANRLLAALQLRRIAPTVLVSPAPTSTVIELLREHGAAPVLESASGSVVVPEARERRASARRRHADPVVRTVGPDVAGTLVAALRAGEEAAAYERQRRERRAGPELPSTDPTTAMALLREAAADRQPVWVGYADSVGAVERMLFYPDRVEGGRVHGHSDGVTRTLSIHRVTGVASE